MFGNPLETAEDYLSLIDGWVDPWPSPVLELHEGFMVVRDDLLDHGTKIRGVDYLIGHMPHYAHIKEWVFGGCPATGYAQIGLPIVCAKYNKKAVLFMAKRNVENLHEYQKRGIANGADIRWVENGMLTVTKCRAREYVEAKPETRELLPLGLEHPTVIASFIKVARAIDYKPTEVWTVASSGTLNRSMQLAWPDAEIHCVSVGHSMNAREIGRAIFHKHPLPFSKAVNASDSPPFPSAPTYDAKAWSFMREKAIPGALFWNVGY